MPPSPSNLTQRTRQVPEPPTDVSNTDLSKSEKQNGIISTPAQLPCVVLEQSAEDDRSTLQHTVALTSSNDDEGELSPNRQVYIQVMVQVGGQQHVPVNIPAEVVMPALLSSLNASKSIATSTGSSSCSTSSSLNVDQSKKQTLSGFPRPSASTPSPPAAVNYLGPNKPSSVFSNQLEITKRQLSSDSDNEDPIRQLQTTSNKDAASRCRKKKKQQVEDMETKAKAIKLANKQLEDEMHDLKEEIAMYERQLLEHQHCFSQSQSNVFYLTTM